MRVGISSVNNGLDMTVYSNEFLTEDSHRKLAIEQIRIGWDNFLQDRVTIRWRLIGPAENYTQPASEWSKGFVKAVVQYGMNLWVLRNQLVHGNPGDISLAEQTKAKIRVENLYLGIAPWVPEDRQWLFHTPLERKLDKPCALHMAWIDSIKQVFPAKYKEIHTEVSQTDIISQKLEYNLAQKTGQTGL